MIYDTFQATADTLCSSVLCGNSSENVLHRKSRELQGCITDSVKLSDRSYPEDMFKDFLHHTTRV